MSATLTVDLPSTSIPAANINMSKVVSIILGGGQGTRLFPLTTARCKPAMCYGGRYRLVDIPISNAINSGSQKIYVITQFLSVSLHQHIALTYRFGSFSSGFIDILSAEERPSNRTWFQGTADAVRQNLPYFEESGAEYFLILSGDQVYSMDYRAMVAFAKDKDADVVVASLPVSEVDTKRMGIMQINDENKVIDFLEKPQEKELLKKIKLTQKQINSFDIDPKKGLNYLGSMGIYLFKRQALIDLLNTDPREDFGKHLIPTQISLGNIFAYVYQGYWEDIGTIDSFYKANIALTNKNPVFDCYNEEWRIYSQQTNLPGARIFDAKVNQSIICEGSIVEAQEVTNSILGPRTHVKKGSIIRDTYVMGNDFYTRPEGNTCLPPNFHIGENCHLSRCIIDKHSSIGNRVKLTNKDNLTNYDGEKIFIRDGIIIVPKGSSIPDGFSL